MQDTSNLSLRKAIAFSFVAALATSCGTVTPESAGKTPVCQECFDAVSRARVDHPASGPTHNEVLRTYECPCCKTQMSVYIANGVHMVKCGGCAVDGVAWDRCSAPRHDGR